MRDIRAGRQPRAVPTVVVEQHEMAPWARGIVWDTRRPHDCVPVRRSSRDTVFPGSRQLDRTALRQAASELDWHDAFTEAQRVASEAFDCAQQLAKDNGVEVKLSSSGSTLNEHGA